MVNLFVRKHIFWTLIVVMLFSLFANVISSPAAAELPRGSERIPNGGFEAVTNGFPNNWKTMLIKTNLPANAVTSDTVTEAEGGKSIKLYDDGSVSNLEVGVKTSQLPTRYGNSNRVNVKANITQGRVFLLARYSMRQATLLSSNSRQVRMSQVGRNRPYDGRHWESK